MNHHPAKKVKIVISKIILNILYLYQIKLDIKNVVQGMVMATEVVICYCYYGLKGDNHGDGGVICPATVTSTILDHPFIHDNETCL